MSTPSPVHKNRFETLSGTQGESTSQEKRDTPPPIFPYGIENHQKMRQLIEK